MNIAILTLDPCISGTVRWTEQVRDGLRALGHGAWTVSATKSGKPRVSWGRAGNGAQWWMNPPDVTVKHEQVAAYLDQFDFVIVNDVACSTLDGVSRAKAAPYYVAALEQTKTPWTAVAHGNVYDDRHTPHTATIFGSPSFCGTIITHPAAYDYAQHKLFSQVKRIETTLPYRCVGPYSDAPSPGEGIGSMARFTGHKGMHVLGLSTVMSGRAVHLHGACVGGARPNDAYLLWETLRDQFGAEGEYVGGKSQTNPYTSDLSNFGQVNYHGNFTSGYDVALTLRTYVNLTVPTFTAGHEYTVLEAMDAGCIPILPTHIKEDQHWALTSHEIGRAPLGSVAVAKDLSHVDPVNYLLDQADMLGEEQCRQAVYWNRHLMRQRNDPSVVVSKILEAVL